MTDQETEIHSAYESTLSAEMSDVATTASVASVGSYAGSKNFYLVIEPDSDSQREVIQFTGVSGLDFTGASGANRYLDGSAAGSGLTHPNGSVIRAVALGQMWDDAHDRIDALDHGADLAGLSDDDHSQYHTDARAVTWHDAQDHAGVSGFGAWTDWSGSAAWEATGANPTGYTVNKYNYTQIGKLVVANAHFTMGADNGSGSYHWTIPVASTGDNYPVGTMHVVDNGVGSVWDGHMFMSTSGLVQAFITGTSADYLVDTNDPFSWDPNDYIRFQLIYEAA